jgi:hypothetical protein
VKFSYRQILASAGGAVLSAVIASIFGVKGTIVGVAIGSIAATTGTALVFQSLEKTNAAVKQVVVRAPDTSLLRRLGGTGAAGVTASEATTASPVAEATATSAVGQDQSVEADRSKQAEGTEDTEGTEPTAAVRAEAPTTRSGAPGLRWPMVAGVVAIVFVFSLLFVTAVELIAGRPLADLFGAHQNGGTTVERIFESPPTTVAPTTTTTSPPTSTTTTSTASTTTTTTVAGSTTTSTGTGSTTTSTTSGTDTTTSTSPATGSSG